MKSPRAIIAIGHLGERIQLSLVIRPDDALVQAEADDDAYRESATAEAESEDLVVLEFRQIEVRIPFFLGGRLVDLPVILRKAVVPADELVDIDDVASQSDAERAAKNGKGLEIRRPHAVVIKRDLVRAGEVECFEGTPDVGT